jgi:hypothetical protein
MRLLNTRTLKLHEFFDSNIPPYAILSHTWGEGEVSFQELQSGDGKSKAGYNKIRRCCEMAASDGFEYVWADTCCIDKTSSTELSEAINSMYRWYRFSDVCYAYLADVPTNLGTKTTEQAFYNSRWFTRGWTLQELVAPSSVIFFNQEWEDLGSKGSLEALIMEITSIHKEVLRDADKMQDFSVAQKMSWASKRKTTRAEDIAYCLLGIFGINMPMLYGEGDGAFIRLQEEIIRKTDDHSIFAWRGFPGSDFKANLGLLAAIPAYFSGSGNIIRAKNLIATPFSMTNKGIRLNLRIKREGETDKYLAVFDCQEEDRKATYLGVLLKQLPGSEDEFRRDSPHVLCHIDAAEISDFEKQDILVKQETKNYANTPEYYSYFIAAKELEKLGVFLCESYPIEKADLDSPIEHPSIGNGVAVVHAFRFSDKKGAGFIVLLQLRATSSSPFTPSLSLLVKVIEDTQKPPQNTMSLGEIYAIIWNSKVWKGGNEDQVIWQHPVQKWWIKVQIRRRVISGERVRAVHITWHTPKEDNATA